jgi:hypothetical protein
MVRWWDRVPLFECADLFQILVGARGLFPIKPGNRETYVDEDEISRLYFRREREIHGLADAAEVDITRAESGIYPFDVEHFSGDCQAHRKLPACNYVTRPTAGPNRLRGIPIRYMAGCARLRHLTRTAPKGTALKRRTGA